MSDDAGAPTLQDVAELAGVSRQTVSNAVNNPELLRPETLERVREAIARLGYSPNRAARSLRTKASHLIGLRFSDVQEGTANATMDRFVHSLVETSADAGYHVLLFAGDDGDGDLVKGYDELQRSTAVDAFVVTDTYLGNPQVAWLAQQRLPFVAFGRPWAAGTDEPPHAWVDVDGAAGTRLATEHLIERGHTHIAWLGWTRDSAIGEDRRAGWMDALAAQGLCPGPERAVADTIEAAATAAAGLLDADEAPTAFVCVSDTVAMGVLHTLWIRQLAPGTDVAVVGFDDSQVAQVYPVGLTSVRQPLEQVAVEIVGMLRELIDGNSVPTDGVLLTPRLVVRESS